MCPYRLQWLPKSFWMFQQICHIISHLLYCSSMVPMGMCHNLWQVCFVFVGFMLVGFPHDLSVLWWFEYFRVIYCLLHSQTRRNNRFVIIITFHFDPTATVWASGVTTIDPEVLDNRFTTFDSCWQGCLVTLADYTTAKHSERRKINVCGQS